MIKRGSRGAASVVQLNHCDVVYSLQKYLIKKLKTLAIHQFLCLDPPLMMIYLILMSSACFKYKLFSCQQKTSYNAMVIHTLDSNNELNSLKHLNSK